MYFGVKGWRLRLRGRRWEGCSSRLKGWRWRLRGGGGG